MIYSQPYIVFSASNTVEKTHLRRRLEVDAELTDLLDQQGIQYQAISINVDGEVHPAVLTTFTVDKLNVFKVLVGDFNVNSFYTINGDKSFTVHTTDGEVSYDSYTVSSTKPIENYIELSKNCFISF